MGIESDPALCDPNTAAGKEKASEKSYNRALSWHLRSAGGVLLARAAGHLALLRTARVIYDIGRIENGKGKFLYLYDKTMKFCATISTKTSLRQELQPEKKRKRRKRKVPE